RSRRDHVRRRRHAHGRLREPRDRRAPDAAAQGSPRQHRQAVPRGFAVEIFDDLDVSASTWIPELDGRITLRHLLAHRSGLFDYMWDGETYEQLAFGPP